MPAKRRPRRGSTGPDVVFWMSRPLASNGGLEQPPGFLLVEALDLDDLSALGLTGRHPNCSGRNAECVGEKSNQRLVRPPSLWRRRDAYFPAVPVATDDRV
jgi:hypothetical protein